MDDVDLFYAEVGRRVRRARITFRGEAWTQGQLAQRVNLTRSSIANLEAGRQRIPVHTLVEVAGALRVPVEDLMPGVLEHEPPVLYAFADDVPASSREFVLRCLAAARTSAEPSPGA